MGLRWKNLVRALLVWVECFDKLDEEEDGDEKEESGAVMIGRVGKNEEQDGDECGKESECFPAANFWRADHCWIECIAQAWFLPSDSVRSFR